MTREAPPLRRRRACRVAVAIASMSVVLPVDVGAAREPLGSTIEFTHLTGRWRVTGVQPDAGIGAYARNDPAYMGRILVISTNRLVWADPKAKGATLGDVCEGPVTQRLVGQAGAHYRTALGAQVRKLGVDPRDPHGVECLDGQWGPEALRSSPVREGPLR